MEQTTGQMDTEVAAGHGRSAGSGPGPGSCGHNDHYCDYMDIGVRELKATLSAVLQRASAGEHITVTDRGRPVAVIGPPVGVVDLDAAVAAGWVTPAATAGLAPQRRFPAVRPVLDVLAEDRAE